MTGGGDDLELSIMSSCVLAYRSSSIQLRMFLHIHHSASV